MTDYKLELEKIFADATLDVGAAVQRAYQLGRAEENQNSTYLRLAMAELANLSDAKTWSPAWNEHAVREIVRKVQELAEFKPDLDQPLYRRTKALREIAEAVGLPADTLVKGNERQVVASVRELIEHDKRLTDKVSNLETTVDEDAKAIKKLEERNERQKMHLQEIAEIVGLAADKLELGTLVAKVRNKIEDERLLRMNLNNSRRREDALRAEKIRWYDQMSAEYQRGRRDASQEILKATLNSGDLGSVEMVYEGGKVDVRNTCEGGC